MMMPKQKPVKPAPPMAPSCAPVKPKSAAQVGQDAAADAEADARRKNGQEAGPQQPLGVRCDGVGAYSRIAHGCPLSLWLTAYGRVPRIPGPFVSFATRLLDEG